MTSTGRCPAGCGRTVWWVLTRNDRKMPLDPWPDPLARGFIPLRGRAWEPWELRAAGEPWSDWADAPQHRNHITTCRNWRAQAAKRRRSTVHRPELACHSCGAVDATVRHITPDVDLCRDCRPREESSEPDSTPRNHLNLT